jgi:hypothetical protein
LSSPTCGPEAQLLKPGACTQLIGWKRAILQTRRAGFFVCHFRAISESHRQILLLGIDHTAMVVSDAEAA